MVTPFLLFLDWDLNCQFAGLLWAREERLFADAGLDVTLVSPRENPEITVLDLVLDGGLCAGCMEDNLIVRAAAAGKGVKAIGATMQDSAIQLITLRDSGIRSLQDVPGHRVAMHRDGIHLLETVLSLHGIDPIAVDFTVADWTLERLVDGTFAAVQGYTMTEPHLLTRSGIATRLIPIRHNRLHPWAQMMFTTDTVIADHTEILQGFIAACQEGWRQAMADREKTAEMVAANSDEHDDPSENIHILALMKRLVAGDRGPEHCVATDPDRWRRNLATYAAYGMVNRKLTYDDVVCDRFM